MTIDLRHGDALEVLRTLADNSVHSIVTDPPYGLKFMAAKWDYDVPSTAVWAECLRVLRPGGYLLAFASTRTQHRMATRIEDAGFYIQDMIAWVHSGGMPKSKDVAKAIDAALGTPSTPTGVKVRAGGRAARGGRELVGSGISIESMKWRDVTQPTSPEALEWQGWGTALKPSLEPITMAIKPRQGTIAENVLRWGTGALNIDACRIGGDGAGGRWPATLMHDGSEEVVRHFPQKAGAKAPVTGGEPSMASAGRTSNPRARIQSDFHDDEGSAARFFYCAKASPTDRKEGSGTNEHITVKPTDLMRELVRLVTPLGGTTLDPFMGSGSTGKAAELEGFDFIGIDIDADNVSLAKLRIAGDVPLLAPLLQAA